MLEIVGDSEIGEMIAEAKYLPSDWQARLADLREASRFLEGAVHIVGDSGRRFRVIVRRHRAYLDNFTVILTTMTGDGSEFRLLRYDGSNHPHRNKIEGNWIIKKPHIHRATERYQELRWGLHDGYAEETRRYDDLSGAWECFLADTNLQAAEGARVSALPDLFTEV